MSWIRIIFSSLGNSGFSPHIKLTLRKDIAMEKIAIVTGGTRGIGAAISSALQGRGYQVAANYAENHARAAEFSNNTGIPSYQFDVSSYKACMEGVRNIEEELGGTAEILINNAGITRDSTLHKMEPMEWQAVVDTNLGSCFNMCRCVIEGMRKHGFGRIVNVGSINGQAGQYGQVNYAAAKSGIHGFTKALAQEGAGKNVTINAIAPGYIDTEMVRDMPEKVLDKVISKIPVGRLGRAEDIARAVVFLVAEEAGFITGSTLSINGGQHMY